MRSINKEFTIKTPVDKFVDMIRINRDISVDSASKILSIEKNTIANWINILESAGVIKVKYKTMGGTEFIVCY